MMHVKLSKFKTRISKKYIEMNMNMYTHKPSISCYTKAALNVNIMDCNYFTVVRIGCYIDQISTPIVNTNTHVLTHIDTNED